MGYRYQLKEMSPFSGHFTMGLNEEEKSRTQKKSYRNQMEHSKLWIEKGFNKWTIYEDMKKSK